MRFWILLLLTITTYQINAQVGDLNFLKYSINQTHDSGDIDNDGDLDIVTLQYSNLEGYRHLTWFENTDGLGNTWEAHSIDVPDFTGQGIVSIRIADVTQDGWNDIVLGARHTLVHTGDPSQISFTSIVNPSNSYGEFILTDTDQDGDLDLILYGASNVTFHAYENVNQDGTFENQQTYTTNIQSQQIKEIVANDIDMDGAEDLIVALKSNTNNSLFIYIFPGNQGGGYGTPNFIFSFQDIGNQRIAIGVSQFDFVGMKEIIVNTEFQMYLLSESNIWQPQIISTGLPVGDIEIADFDMNGQDDIIIGTDVSFSGDLYWLKNLGGGMFFEENIITSTSDYSFGYKKLVLGDFDNDSDIDATFLNDQNDSHIGVFLVKNNLSTTNSFDTLVKVSDNIVQPHVHPIDFDNDLDNDLVLYSRLEQQVYWLENLNIVDDFSKSIALFPNEKFNSFLLEDLNGDGQKDIIGINEEEELVWYQKLTGLNVEFAPRQILATGLYSENLEATDIDNDGDLDIAAIQIQGGIRSIYWYEQINITDFTPHLIATGSENFQIVKFADMNNDGLADLLYRDIISNQNELQYFQQGPGTSFTSTPFLTALALEVTVTDIDDDNDDDLLIKYSQSGSFFSLFINESGTFNEHLITENLEARYFKVADLDADGLKDIYVGEGFFKQLGDPSNFSTLLPLIDATRNSIALSDLDNDGVPDFIYNINYDDLMWRSNQLVEASYIEGQVFLDQNDNCIIDQSIDSTLYGWTIELENNGNTYFTSTNINGFYAALLPNPGDYFVNLKRPNAYWSTCFTDTLIADVNPDNVSFLDLIAQIEFECPLMQINLNSSLYRPCIDGNVSVYYCNEGTAIAEDATVEVVLDDHLIFNNASAPFTETDTSYIFEVGDVDIQECGTILLYVTPDCDSTEVGDILCNNAYVTPDSLCTPLDSQWDGSTIEVNGFCLDDSIHFELRNIGNGAMSEARMFRIEIVNDDIVLMIEADTFELAPDESKWVHIGAEMDALRLEADQDENHPILTTASTLVNECADLDFSINLLPNNNGNPFFDTHCRSVTGSYDPNLKEAIPAGYSDQNYIDRNWELDYTIHFQNTGNDTAFTVVIEDPISEHLDLSTLRVAGGSHPFSWELNTDRILSFTFDNILLPDSTTNEPASHGYVQFSIQPMTDIPFETMIKNQVAIFFDFNDPIITNQVFHTIRTPIIASSFHIDICEGEEYLSIPIFNDTLIVDSTSTAEGLHLDFNHIHSIPPSLVYVDTSILIGTIFNGIEITQDTVIETLFENSLGCDSLVITNIIANTTSVDDLLKNTIQVFPIPTKNELQIRWATDQLNPRGLTLISSDGQLLKSFSTNENTFNDHQLNINLAAFPRGVYWIKIDLEDNSVYRKVIKL